MSARTELQNSNDNSVRAIFLKREV